MIRPSRVVRVTVILAAALTTSGGCGVPYVAPSPEPAAGHTWNQTHRVDPPSGWTVTGRNVGPTDESTSLAGPGSTGCLVQVWSTRPQRQLRPRWPDRVQVQGQKGDYGDLDPDYGPYPRAVVWRAGDDRWIGVSCDLDRSGLLEIAERVRSEVAPMLVPFRLTSPPDGVSMVQLIESRDGDVRTFAAQFETAGASRPLVMQISDVRDRSVLQGPVQRQQINGRTAEIRTASQMICLRTRSTPICVSGPGDEPATDWALPDARRIAQQTAERLVPVDDPDDYSSWIDADTAFGG